MPGHFGGGFIASAKRTPWPVRIAASYPGTAWFDIDDLTIGSVTTWTDKLSGHAPTNATPSERPVLEATPFSGKRGLRFTRANNSKLTGAPGLAAMMDNTDQCTVLYMAQPAALSTAASTYHTAVGAGTVASTTRAAFLGYRTQNSPANNYDSVNHGTSADGTGKWGVTRGVQSSVYNGTTLQAWKDGVSSYGPTAQATLGTLDLFSLGAQRYTGAWFHHFDGWIGDVVVIPGALSDADRQAGEAWLRAKFYNRPEVILFYGDSYMENFVSEALPASYPSAGIWMVRDAMVIEPMVEPTGQGYPLNTPGASIPGLIAASRRAVTGRDIILVNGGWGGKRSDEMIPGTTQYIEFMAKTAVAAAAGDFAGAVLISGYNNAAQNIAVASYTSDVLATEAGIRAVYPGSWKHAYLQIMSSYLTNPAGLASIVAQQAALVSAARPRFVMPNSTPLQGDNIHPTLAGNQVIAAGLYPLL